MISKRLIKRLWCFVVLVVFTIGVIPKIYFHDLLQQHSDHSFTTGSNETQFNHYKYNCGFVNADIISPFTVSEGAKQNAVVQFAVATSQKTVRPFFIHNCENLSLRAPPIA